VTGQDGSFRFDGITKRNFYLLASKADRTTVKQVAGGKSDLLIVLKAPPRIITQPPPQVDKVTEMVGRKAPSLLVGEWANTAPIDITHTKSKAVVLNFWGGTCPACVVELPDVQQYADQIAEQGVLLVGIHDSVSTSPEVKKFLSDHQVRFPVAIDTKDHARGFGKTFQAFNVAASPAFVVIQDGKIVFATHSLEEMMAFVNKL
jgi:peroxiredoxin